MDAVRIVRKIWAKLWPSYDQAVFWSGKTDGISIMGYAQKWAKENKKQTINLALKSLQIKFPMDRTLKIRVRTIADRLGQTC